MTPKLKHQLALHYLPLAFQLFAGGRPSERQIEKNTELLTVLSQRFDPQLCHGYLLVAAMEPGEGDPISTGEGMRLLVSRAGKHELLCAMAMEQLECLLEVKAEERAGRAKPASEGDQAIEALLGLLMGGRKLEATMEVIEPSQTKAH